jgi:hypothetical protein
MSSLNLYSQIPGTNQHTITDKIFFTISPIPTGTRIPNTELDPLPYSKPVGIHTVHFEKESAGCYLVNGRSSPPI